jgi:hypothetical protein
MVPFSATATSSITTADQAGIANHTARAMPAKDLTTKRDTKFLALMLYPQEKYPAYSNDA